MIVLRRTLSNVAKVVENMLIPGKPWVSRESVLISSVDKTIPELLNEGKKIVAVRPGSYTIAIVSAELTKNNGVVVSDYWPKTLDFKIEETSDGKIYFTGVNNEIFA